jgi:hypothetical protein
VPVGTPAYGSINAGDGTTTTAGYPIGNVDDLIFFVVLSGETNNVLPTCSDINFVKDKDVDCGTGAYANNGGIRHISVYRWIATSALSGTVDATIGGDPTNRTIMSFCVRVPKSAGETWDLSYASGNKTSATNSISILTSPQLNWVTGDVVLALGGSAYDVPAWSAEAVSAPGVVFGALTESQEGSTSIGFDGRMTASDGVVTSGSATGATTFTANLSGSGTAGVILVRLAVVAGGTDATPSPSLVSRAISVGASVVSAGADVATALVSQAFEIPSPVVTTVGASLRVLLVCSDTTDTLATLSGDVSGQAIYDHRTAKGDTVTLAGESDVVSGLDTNYDLIWISNSVPQATDMAALGYDATTTPVIACGLRSPHSSYSNVFATTSTSQTTVYVKSQGMGDPTVPSDIVTPQVVTVLDTAFTARYILDTNLGSGHHQIASRNGTNLNNLCFTRYAAGDLMNSGVAAPSNRAWFLLHPGSIGSNVRGWQFLDLLVDWATGTASSGNSVVSPASVARAVSIPTLSFARTATAAPAGVSALASVGAPVIPSLVDAVPAPTTVLGVTSISSMNGATASEVDVASVSRAVSIGSPVVSLTGNAQPTPAVLSRAVVLPAPVVTANMTLVVSAVNSLSVINIPVVHAQSFVNVTAVLAGVGVGVVAVQASQFTAFYLWDGSDAVPLNLEGRWNGTSIDPVTFDAIV